jgi:hypothetical protein
MYFVYFISLSGVSAEALGHEYFYLKPFPARLRQYQFLSTKPNYDLKSDNPTWIPHKDFKIV